MSAHHATLPPTPATSLSMLETLPTEVLALIASFSGPISTLQLKRCSQVFQSKLPLDQAFWRDALISGLLVDYLWDLEPTLCLQKDSDLTVAWDWRRLAQALKAPNILCTAIGNSIRGYRGGEGDDETIDRRGLTVFQERCLDRTLEGHTEFDDAPQGLPNRCRIVRIVRDVEIIDQIEANEPLVDNGGEMVKKRHYGGLWGEEKIVSEIDFRAVRGAILWHRPVCTRLSPGEEKQCECEYCST